MGTRRINIRKGSKREVSRVLVDLEYKGGFWEEGLSSHTRKRGRLKM
jgi:hypothetical protein